MGISYGMILLKPGITGEAIKCRTKPLRIDLELPRELFIKGRESVQRAKLEALKRLAATFYADGSLSLGKAAELAKVSKQEFVDFLATCNIPLNYDVNELEDDLATIAAMQPNDQGDIASDPKTQTKPKGVVRAVAGIWKDRPDLVEEMLRMREDEGEDEDDRLGTTIEYAIERPRVPWQYDEMQQVGVDYTSLSEVEAYDERMAKLRDVKQEIENTINLLGIGPEDLLVEFGAGTGEFALRVAKHCKRVIAVDVSAKMLEYAEKKSKERGVDNVDFYHGGFLTYQHSGAPVNFVVTQFALHHLPDFWKFIALKRVYSMLTEGGTLYLRDTVYSFNINHCHQFFDQWISGTRALAGEELAKDVETAVRDEFSTCDWIMEGLLKRVGFTIQQVKYDQGFLAQYVCKKA